MNAHVPLISLVFPVWNEEENLPPLYEQVTEALRQAEVSYELVFVDNGSQDGSLAIIQGWAAADPTVRYCSLARNFGHQGGILAGLEMSRGAAVITMDADCQHPPALLPQMIAAWRHGADVVFTTKKNYQTSWWRRWQVRAFYWLMSRLSGLKLSFGQSDFRLLDRRVVEVILRMPEYRKFIRGLVQWMGFRQTGLEYTVVERHAGASKFSYRSLFSFAADGILAFSFLPLRWSLWMGLSVALVCVGYAAYIAVLGALKLYFGFGELPVPPGWATITAAILFLASIQLIAIGVLSEYVGRVFEQTKGRPIFVVRESSDMQKGAYRVDHDGDSVRREGKTATAAHGRVS
ncbi:MAG: glycosyltransferase family 2 protein [Deltaproteobacteria bacterium]|nr:glycosyltransferase family 2 protein [Deltaproteobacteria bacterium]